MNRRLSRTSRTNPESGFSLIEMLIVLLILGVLGALAIPTWQRIQKNARLNGDAHNIGESLSVAKMRAGANFTYSRIFLFTGTDQTQYFRVDTWNSSIGANGCWVPDGLANPTSANCITSSTVTGYENRLATGVSAGFGSLSTVPSTFVTTLAQADACWKSGTTPISGSQISNTACIVFNSRGFPVAPGGFYLTDGTRVFGVVTNAVGLMHSYVSDASTATWTAY